MGEQDIPPDELKEIESHYERAMYKELADCLEEFLKAHAKEIPGFKERVENKLNRSFSLKEAINLFILDNKIVNLKLDLKDQKEEIEKEIWYRKERHEDPDPEAVAEDWTKKYAEAWRAHRTREIIYVFRREAGKYLNLVYQHIERD